MWVFGTAEPLWAQGGTPILIEQASFQKTIFPIVGDLSAEEFYNYSSIDYSSRTSLETPRASLLFFYRERGTGRLALIIINNAPQAGPGGRANLKIEGLPLTAQLVLRDDPTDQYVFEPPSAQFEWRWASGHTDGVVISGLKEPFTLTITPEFAQGIMAWKLLTLNDPKIGIERVLLPSLEEPLVLRVGVGAPAQAAFHYTPTDIRVGIPVLFDARPSQVLFGEITLYEWDFDGDGVFEVSTADPLVTHTFSEAGTFTVTLRVTDPSGLMSTASQVIVVREERAVVRRRISTPQVQPGGVFRVTVTLEIEVPSNGLGLEEEVPLGWAIEPVRNDGAIFKFSESRGQWLFPTLLKIGEKRRIIYDVRLPPAEKLSGASLPSRFAIRGAVTSVSPEYVIPVTGESEIEVVSCLSMPTAIAHLDLARGIIDLRGSELISPEQLSRAVEFWQSALPVPGTCDAKLTSGGLMEVLMYGLLGISVDEALPPPSSDRAFPPVTVTRVITTPLPAFQVYLGADEGRVFQVELVIHAQRDLPGLKVAEQLPFGWRLQPRAVGSAVFRGETHEWVFAEFIPAGETRRLVYEVSLPPDAKAGAVELMGSAESGLMTFLNPITGDSTVNVIECLSVPLAIAHLDVETGAPDIKLDNTITRQQVNLAFMLWFEDREVPGTCGKKLDLPALQRIISHMVTGKPVEE